MKDEDKDKAKEDIEFTPDEEELNPAALIKRLRAELKKCEEEKARQLAAWQRDKADFINARRRGEQAKAQFLKFANEELVFELLPVLQSFELAMGSRETWEKVDKNWRVGVENIYAMLKRSLESHGLKEISPLGQPFDVSRDEAIEYTKVTNKDEHHKVVAVIEKGYELNGKIIKPARVKVGEFEEK